MLGPDRPHLLVGCEFTAVCGGLGASNRVALFGRKDNRRSNIGPGKQHNGSRDIILIVRRQTTHGLHCFIEKLCHDRNIGLEDAEVEAPAAAVQKLSRKNGAGYWEPCSAAPAFAPPLETATSAGRSTRSPIM